MRTVTSSRLLTGAAFLCAAVLFCGCSLFPHVEKCPTGTHPCGTGCMPENSVCCDNGSITTSSYCTNMAGGGCYPNTDQACPAAFPMGAVAEFCCGTSGSFGSNDCPEGQHHCGLSCQPMNEPCCPKGASEAECPQRTFDRGGCTGVTGNAVGCAVCLETKTCVSCPAGNCCAGDPCSDQGRCIAGSACVGEGSGGGGSCGLPSQCTSDSHCTEWGKRHCGAGGQTAGRCGTDGLCHCCYQLCDVGSGGTASNCRCLGCDSCGAQGQTCMNNVCVWSAGGAPCD